MKTQKVELHEFEDFGKRGIYHVRGQRFYEIDSWTQKILTLCDGRPVEDIVNQLRSEIPEEEVRSILADLENTRILVDQDVVNSSLYHPPEKIEILHLNLQMTSDCYLNCVHCYLAQTKQRYSSKQRMESRIAQHAVDLLMRESGKLDCYLTFSGMNTFSDGEWITGIIDYANKAATLHEKKISFEVVIDSSLFLEDVEELFSQTFMNRENLMVNVNIKGAETIQRVLNQYPADFTRNSEGPKLGLNIFVEGYLSNFMQLMHQVIQVVLPQSLYVIPSVIANGNVSATNSDIDGAKKLLRELCEYCLQYALNEGMTWIGHIGDQAGNVLKGAGYYYYCGAGTRHLAVSPDGSLYPCADLAADTSYRVGNVDHGMFREQRKVWLQDYHVDKFETCASCWARHLCGGGCRVDSLSNCGNLTEINEATCDLIRYSYELAMLMNLVYFSGDGKPAPTV